MRADDIEDKRNLFAEEIFTYRVSRDGKVFLSWRGRQVKILKGESAAGFMVDPVQRE